MKFNRILLPGVIVLAVLFFLYPSSYPAAPPTVTTVRVLYPVQTKPEPRELISLKSFSYVGTATCQVERNQNFGQRGFYQTFPDGSGPFLHIPSIPPVAPPPANPLFAQFVVPQGKILVVTSLQWSANHFAPDTLAQFRLRRASKQTGTAPIQFNDDPLLVAQASVMPDRVGSAGGELTFPNGVVVKSGAALCAVVCCGPTMGRAGSGAEVTMQGYLAEDFVIPRTPIPKRIAPLLQNKGETLQPAPVPPRK